jgi:DNA-binding transcriptional ArsR family regulator
VSSGARDWAWQQRLPRLPNGAQATAKLVLLYLAERADGNGVCWPSFAAIVEATGSTAPAVNRALRRLTALGLVVATRRSDGLGRRSASRYELRVAVPPTATTPDVQPVARRAQARDTAADRAASPAQPPPSAPRPPNPQPRGGAAVPDRIDLDDRLLAVAREVGLSTEQARRELDACLDWHRANGRRRVDWQATARNWLRKAAQIGQQRASAAPAPGSALPRPTDHGAWQTAADRYGLRARPGEDWPTFQARIRAFIERAGAQ